MTALSPVMIILAALAAALAAALSMPEAIDLLASLRRRLGRKQRTLEDKSQASLLHDILRNGFSPFRQPAGFLLRFDQIRSFGLALARHVEQLGYLTGANQTLELLLVVTLSAGLAFWLLSGNLPVSMGFTLLVPVLIRGYCDGKSAQRQQLMREQLPDALQCLGFCFLVGNTISQAIEQTALETPQPLRNELVRTSDDILSGIGIHQALSDLEKRNNLPELSYLTVALEIQHQTGGSLKDLLESAAESVRTADTLKKQLRVQTAQARLSFKVVALMPAVLVAVLSLVLDGYLEAFFSSPAGLMILVTAIVMEATGILLIRRILGVDLG